MFTQTPRVISSKARNLAKRLMLSHCARSLGASLCRDDTIDETLVLVDNCYIISFSYLSTREESKSFPICGPSPNWWV